MNRISLLALALLSFAAPVFAAAPLHPLQQEALTIRDQLDPMNSAKGTRLPKETQKKLIQRLKDLVLQLHEAGESIIVPLQGLEEAMTLNRSNGLRLHAERHLRSLKEEAAEWIQSPKTMDYENGVALLVMGAEANTASEIRQLVSVLKNPRTDDMGEFATAHLEYVLREAVLKVDPRKTGPEEAALLSQAIEQDLGKLVALPATLKDRPKTVKMIDRQLKRFHHSLEEQIVSYEMETTQPNTLALRLLRRYSETFPASEQLKAHVQSEIQKFSAHLVHPEVHDLFLALKDLAGSWQNEAPQTRSDCSKLLN